MEKNEIRLTDNQLLHENEELLQRVYELEETLNAIRNGNIDAILVSGNDGDKLYSLASVETRYRIIIEEMYEGAVTLTKDGLITYCNTRFAELVSEPVERIVGYYFADFLQDSEKQVFSGLLQAGLDSKSSGELTYIRKDGHSLYFLLSISKLPTETSSEVCILFSDITELKRQEKELVHYNTRLDQLVREKTEELTKTNQRLNTSHNSALRIMDDMVKTRDALEISNKNLLREISERKSVNEALAESENKFKNLVWDMQVGVLLQGPNSEVLLSNPKSLELLGMNEDQLLGKTSLDPYWNVIHEDGSPFPGNMHPVPKAIETRLPVRSVIMGVYNPIIGDRSWIMVDAFPQLNNDGTIKQIVCTFIDITKRKHAEDALKNITARFEALLLQSPSNGVIYRLIRDETGKILDWEITDINEQAAASFGLDRAAAIGKRALDLFGEQVTNPYFEIAQEVITSGKPRIFETWLESNKRAYLTSVFLVDPDHYASISVDITDLKNAESQIKQLNDELELKVQKRTEQLLSSNRELEAFSYSVSHDLRAPLRAVHGYTNILMEEYDNKLDDEGKRLCGIIASNATKMGCLIDDLLSFSRIGRTSMKAGMLEMKPIVDAVFDELSLNGKIKRITHYPGKLHSSFGDANLIKIVWNNLISNAIKYSSRKQNPEIEIGSCNEGNMITYFVKDNGAGFDMQYSNKLFGVFQRLHSDTEFEGNGVGLAIVQRIIIKHGGRIWADGEVGKGATFWFSLPADGE